MKRSAVFMLIMSAFLFATGLQAKPSYQKADETVTTMTVPSAVGTEYVLLNTVEVGSHYFDAEATNIVIAVAPKVDAEKTSNYLSVIRRYHRWRLSEGLHSNSSFHTSKINTGVAKLNRAVSKTHNLTFETSCTPYRC